MPLLLHRAPRADALADGLAALLAEPPEDPFAPELVIVPARGVERWLSQRLSHRVGAAPGREDGLCAGVELRSPASLVGEVLGTTEDDPWSPDALVWPLLQVVDEAAGEPWCQALSLHLGHEHEGEERELRRGRRYATARRLARHLAAYAVQRPSLLADWEAGRDTDGAGGVLDPDLTWQPELWRRLVAQVEAQVGAPSPVVRHREVCDALGSGGLDPDLPARLSLFGHTRLPVTEVRLLAALGERREVHLWLPHPSPASWGALTDLTGSVARDDDPARRRVRHPLLVSLGRDLRELQRSLQDVGPRDVTAAEQDPAGAGATTLLGWLQADLAADRSPDEAGIARVLREDDRSVQVHACHGPARQVEVLREVLLGLLADDPTLEPRDVVVMCPDIEAYAPLVSAAFGMGEIGTHPGHRLRVRLADRSLTQTNPLLAVVERLLDLAGGRAEASVVLDLLATEPVRRRFGLTESDLETLTDWVEKAGVRWAFDGEHRRDFGLERFVQNTWRFGLDRVLTGVAVSDDADRYFGATLPLDDVGSTSIDLAGRLAEALDRVQRLAGALTGSHPVDHWLTTIGRAVEELTLVPRGEEWQTAQVHRELAQVLDASTRSWAGDLQLRLPDVRSLMAERLAGRPTRANFRTGTLTVATMVPMRSVPHRVVCLLGLDDGSFPRVGAVDGDDVLARRPLTGERDVRSEDRQLMLDAVVAATEHLVVTYTGAHETTGAPRPPAVPLGELLDAVELTVPGGRDHVLRSHPLQAFDQDNLVPPRPFSFDGAALAGARAAARPREAPPALAGAVLPRPGGDVELAELSAFLRHPVRHFLRRRLEVALPDEGEEVTDGLPVDLDGLQQWQVGERLLADLLLGRTPGQARDREWRRGVLPPGRLGWDLAKRLADQALPVAELVDSVTQGQRATARDVDVDLGDGRRLRGTVTGIHGTRVVRHSYSRLGPRHYLDAWVPLLALCADSPGRGWTAGSVGRGRFRSQPTARAAFAPVEEAAARLRELVAIYDAGTAEPLPLPLRTGHAWAANPRAARPKAEAEWSRARFGPECEDEAHVRVWGADAPLARLLEQRPQPGEEREGQTTRLGALATTLWRPVLDRARS